MTAETNTRVSLPVVEVWRLRGLMVQVLRVADRVEEGAIPPEHASERGVVAEFRRRLRQAGSLETLRREDPQFVDGVKGHLRDLAVERQSRQ